MRPISSGICRSCLPLLTSVRPREQALLVLLLVLVLGRSVAARRSALAGGRSSACACCPSARSAGPALVFRPRPGHWQRTAAASRCTPPATTPRPCVLPWSPTRALSLSITRAPTAAMCGEHTGPWRASGCVTWAMQRRCPSWISCAASLRSLNRAAEVRGPLPALMARVKQRQVRVRPPRPPAQQLAFQPRLNRLRRSSQRRLQAMLRLTTRPALPLPAYPKCLRAGLQPRQLRLMVVTMAMMMAIIIMTAPCLQLRPASLPALKTAQQMMRASLLQPLRLLLRLPLLTMTMQLPLMIMMIMMIRTIIMMATMMACRWARRRWRKMALQMLHLHRLTQRLSLLWIKKATAMAQTFLTHRLRASK